jgi:hypothetical protein
MTVGVEPRENIPPPSGARVCQFDLEHEGQRRTLKNRMPFSEAAFQRPAHGIFAKSARRLGSLIALPAIRLLERDCPHIANRR